MSFVALDGVLVPDEEARVSVHDRAILFGDAAYETMRSYRGQFFRLAEHLSRLRMTLREMSLDLTVSDRTLAETADRLLEANGLQEARLRLTVTGGAHAGEIRLRRFAPPTWIFTAVPLTPPAEHHYRDGVAVTVAPWPVHRASPLPRIKTVNRLVHLMAKEEALNAGAYDALFTDEEGNLLEGTATNALFVVDGTLRTAPLSAPLLAGVTRDAVVQAARAEGLAVVEEPVAAGEVARAEEGFLTSTTIELLPVVRVGEAVLGSGRPGPVWRRLLARYRQMVSEETGVALDPLPPGAG